MGCLEIEVVGVFGSSLTMEASDVTQVQSWYKRWKRLYKVGTKLVSSWYEVGIALYRDQTLLA